MKAKVRDDVTATSTQYFDAMLAVSTIYFDGMSALSELALTTSRETVRDCLSASSAVVESVANPAAGAPRLTAGQEIIERLQATATESSQVLLRSQQEATKVLEARFWVPLLQVAMPTNLTAVFEMFSRGMDQLSELNAASISATTRGASAFGQETGSQSVEVA